MYHYRVEWALLKVLMRISVVSRVRGQVSYACCFSNIRIAVGSKGIKELSLGAL